MKHQWKAILFFAMVITLIACKKTTPDINSRTVINNVLTQSIANTKQGEPVLLSFDTGNDTATVNWQVNPDSNYTMSKAGVYATVYFAQPGNYTVKALVGNKQATYTITITNSVYTDTDTSFTLKASKFLDVLPNEVVSFTVNNLSTNKFIWSTSGNVSLANTSSNPADCSFASGASGTVRTTVGNKTTSRTVWLKDTAQLNRDRAVVPFIFSDQLTITPSVEMDSNNQKVLVLTAKTQYKYQSNKDSILNFADNYNGDYTLSYGGVAMASTPKANITAPSCIDRITNVPIGTHKFSINVGNKTIVGNVTLTASGVFTFGLAKNNLVSIYPLTVQ